MNFDECERLGKENLQPAQTPEDDYLQLRNKKQKFDDESFDEKRDEERRKQAMVEACRQAEAAAKVQRLHAGEAKRLAEEKAWQRRTWLEAEEKTQKEAEIAAIAAEAERLVQEARQDKLDREVAQHNAELAAAKERVSEWCRKNSFRDMNTQKKTMRGATKFPLHTAVKHQNDEMVELMLKCGVSHHVKTSGQQTPAELAMSMNKNGSHEQIIALLH